LVFEEEGRSEGMGGEGELFACLLDGLGYVFAENESARERMVKKRLARRDKAPAVLVKEIQ
jgi:hypothetical protein